MIHFRTYLFCFWGIMFLDSCFSKDTDTRNSVIENQLIPDSIKAIGIWEVPGNERAISGTNSNGSAWVALPSPSIFIYDGRYITLRLVTISDWIWKSEDDYSRVNSTWHNDTLFWLPPFGRWEKLMVFKNDHFEDQFQKTEDRLHTWVYRKITPSEVAPEDSLLIKIRKPHDYSIRKNGGYQ